MTDSVPRVVGGLTASSILAATNQFTLFRVEVPTCAELLLGVCGDAAHTFPSVVATPLLLAARPSCLPIGLARVAIEGQSRREHALDTDLGSILEHLGLGRCNALALNPMLQGFVGEEIAIGTGLLAILCIMDGAVVRVHGDSVLALADVLGAGVAMVQVKALLSVARLADVSSVCVADLNVVAFRGCWHADFPVWVAGVPALADIGLASHRQFLALFVDHRHQLVMVARMAASARVYTWAAAHCPFGRLTVLTGAFVDDARPALQGVAEMAVYAQLLSLHRTIRFASSDSILARAADVDALLGVHVVAMIAGLADDSAMGVAILTSSWNSMRAHTMQFSTGPVRAQ
mmetsp:Transcript_20944/g.45253  ORF Transcript_20944/g.45253 Transcript_20944/m.45253 type:complete len:347 (-) Transcript_20944:1462-2502(-)